MSDFWDALLRGPSNRPQHPDFMKLSDIVLRHDGPTSDPTTKEQFSFQDTVNAVIDLASVTYMAVNRTGVYLQQLGLDDNPELRALAASAWLDAFLVGVEWQKAKDNAE